VTIKKPSHESARVHLTVFGQSRPVDVRVRRGPAQLADLVRPARAITEAIAAASVEHVEAEGRRVTCAKGCASCCRQVVPISLIEAVALAKVVDDMPRPERDRVKARFAAALGRLEELRLLPTGQRGRSALVGRAGDSVALWREVSQRYFDARIACPFLVNEVCSIYAERPVVCREYLVTSPPSGCDVLGNHVEAVPRPVRMTEVLGEVLDQYTDLGARAIPLVLALEWAAAYGAELAGEHDGAALFEALIVHASVDEGG